MPPSSSSSSSLPAPSSAAHENMEAMRLLLKKIQKNVELLTEAGALGLFYKQDIRLSGLAISFEPDSGFSFDCAYRTENAPQSCRNIHQATSYRAVLDPLMSAACPQLPSPAPALLAHRDIDSFLAQGWSRAAEIICEADARYRMLHGLIQSPMDLSACAEVDDHPLSLIAPADLAEFSAWRRAATTTEMLRSSERLELLLELNAAIRRHVDDMRSKDLLIHHFSIHLTKPDHSTPFVKVFSNAYYDGSLPQGSHGVSLIPPAAQPLGNILIELNPLNADLADDAEWARQCSAIAALGRPAYIEGLWREIEPQIIAAGDRLCSALGLAPPAGLLALREREALEASLPLSALSRRKGPL